MLAFSTVPSNGLCEGIGRDSDKTTSSFCHLDPAALSTGVDSADSNPTHCFANV